MSAFNEYDMVRVRTLDGMRHDCAGLGTRAPAIGDTGTVVSILACEGREAALLVECVAPDATTLWMASFPENALERMKPAETTP